MRYHSLLEINSSDVERQSMKIPARVFLLCLVLFSVLQMGSSISAMSPVPLQPHAEAGQAHDCGGEPCDAVARGLLAFFDRRLTGLGANGRSCADCHMATDNFQLSPASAEARFGFLQLLRRWNPKADDPLFRPIDADDFRINGVNANDFSNLRQNGLVRIVFTLPLNIQLIDPATNLPSTEKFVDVWRMVPTVNDVALTGPDNVNPWPRGPNATGGYQLDARLRTLQEQALGALTNHAEVHNTPPQQLLDDLASFQRVLFTNHRVRALSDAIRAGSGLPDADPPLNELEQQGKIVFVRACKHCHGGPAQSNAEAPIVRFHDIATQCPRPIDRPADPLTPARFAFAPCPPRLARNARTYEITQVDGSKVRRTSSDPGRALLTGFVGGPPPLDDWNKFDTPGLRGIRNTAPYFHNNSAATLDDVVNHYIEFFKRVKANTAPGAPPPPVATTDGVNFNRAVVAEERVALLAYLRKL
jgi:cytochrome c peroxidase